MKSINNKETSYIYKYSYIWCLLGKEGINQGSSRELNQSI